MMKRITLCLMTVLLMLLVACGEQEMAPAPPPPAVSVVEIAAEDVPLYLEFVGETGGLKDIAIRARVEGFLEGLHFQEGSEVKKGDLLYTLESQPFEEKVASRMSAVAEAKTMVAKTRGDLGRIEPLAAINAVSKSDLDAAVAAFEASQASLDAAQANLRSVKIELGYTKIFSPINGIIGKTKAKVGDFVGRDPNPVILNTVSQLDTVLVTFFITETQYLQVARNIAESGARPSGDETAKFELILIDGTVFQHKGKADFIDRQVDTTTGAMLVQTSFPNPEKLLRPGQFVKVRVAAKVEQGGILIPQRCVMEMQGLYNVFVVDAGNKVEIREISVGEKVGSFWLISAGLKPGDKVIYEGLQKVKDGATVNPTLIDLTATDSGNK